MVLGGIAVKPVYADGADGSPGANAGCDTDSSGSAAGRYVPVELQVGSGSTVRGVGELNRYEAALSFPEFRK